jgi:histidinol-phosphatase (PHP family)
VIDRQPRDLPLDAHLHTNLSPDSDVAIDVYAAAALERGIEELAITDHVDFEPGAPAYAYATFDDRERIVRQAAERWAPQGVAIRFGVELTYDRSWEADIREHLARHAYDFTIGSVHDRTDSPYSPGNVQRWVDGRSLGEIVAPSFDEVEAAARSGLFDALGHLDVVKRYLYPHVSTAALADAPELYEPILNALVESGTALEINTSGLRHPVGETYPTAAIVHRFRELGGRAVTVGSDAHRAGHFGWALRDGYQYAMDAGFEALTFRRGGERIQVPIRNHVPSRS